MLYYLKPEIEPAWAGRLLYGSVFGCYSVLGVVGIVVSFMKTGNFRFVVGACSVAGLVLALHSLFLGMRPHPPWKKMSSRIILVVLLTVLPISLRPLLR